VLVGDRRQRVRGRPRLAAPDRGARRARRSLPSGRRSRTRGCWR
jgi:hypothetical protein